MFSHRNESFNYLWDHLRGMLIFHVIRGNAQNVDLVDRFGLILVKSVELCCVIVRVFDKF